MFDAIRIIIKLAKDCIAHGLIKIGRLVAERAGVRKGAALLFGDTFGLLDQGFAVPLPAQAFVQPQHIDVKAVQERVTQDAAPHLPGFILEHEVDIARKFQKADGANIVNRVGAVCLRRERCGGSGRDRWPPGW